MRIQLTMWWKTNEIHMHRARSVGGTRPGKRALRSRHLDLSLWSRFKHSFGTEKAEKVQPPYSWIAARFGNKMTGPVDTLFLVELNRGVAKPEPSIAGFGPSGPLTISKIWVRWVSPIWSSRSFHLGLVHDLQPETIFNHSIGRSSKNLIWGSNFPLGNKSGSQTQLILAQEPVGQWSHHLTHCSARFFRSKDRNLYDPLFYVLVHVDCGKDHGVLTTNKDVMHLGLVLLRAHLS